MTSTIRKLRFALVALSFMHAGLAGARADEESINYDEAIVPAYVLPDPLVMQDGRPVTTAAMWRDERRPEILALFQAQVYGRSLPKPQHVRFRVIENQPIVHGLATRKRIGVELVGLAGAYRVLTVTLLVPRQAIGPVPAFVGMHLFDPRSDDPRPGKPLEGVPNENLPGDRLLEVILQRGYAIATLEAKDFCPDDKQAFRDGALHHYFPDRAGVPGPEEPGAIATWAWGLSRALDYLETDRDVDAHHVAVIGHSRMGKTALWAGAQDERFALVISNDSGCGGASLARRRYGETVAHITRVFPHWFCGNYVKYSERLDDLPVDQHELVALIVPRPVYVASAVEDRWADPRGEFLAAGGADGVYRLLEKPGLGATEPPEPGKSIGQFIGYHIRIGKHALTDNDWLRYLDFADRHFGKRAKSGT